MSTLEQLRCNGQIFFRIFRILRIQAGFTSRTLHNKATSKQASTPQSIPEGIIWIRIIFLALTPSIFEIPTDAHYTERAEIIQKCEKWRQNLSSFLLSDNKLFHEHCLSCSTFSCLLLWLANRMGNCGGSQLPFVQWILILICCN